MEGGASAIVTIPRAEQLQNLLVPLVRHRIEQFGLGGSGAYDFYGKRAERGEIFSDYDLAIAMKLLQGEPDVQTVHEIGCGFGQLVFLLGWNGFKTVGFEADRSRFRAAKHLLAVLDVAEHDLTRNVQLVEGEFPSRTLRPDKKTLVLTTNLVATRSRPQQLAVLAAMREYPLALVDVQRFFDMRPALEDEPAVLALFAEAGLREGRLFLDMGASGRYYLFVNRL